MVAGYLWLHVWSCLIAPMTWMFAAWGLVVGSFLNVCILRIPDGTFFSKARSHCPACGAPIPPYLNIPVFAYLALRGRARCCGAKIHWQYPVVEALTAVLFVVAYWKFPFITLGSPSGVSFEVQNLLRCVHLLVFSCLLLVTSAIDLRHMIIPDVISLPMILATPLVVYLHPDLDATSAAVGVLLGGFVLYAIAWLYWMVRREIGMGMGDVKLLAAIGGWLGYQAVLPTIFYGSVLGALAGIGVMAASRRMTLRTAIPFGPFLAIGAIIHMMLGSMIQELFLAASGA